MSSLVSGIFDDYGIVNKLIGQLHRYGIEDNSISVIGPEQEDTLHLREEAHPAGTPAFLMQFMLLGAIVGGFFALGCLSFTTHIAAATAVLATLAAAAAGAYLGMLTAAVFKLDIAQDTEHFKEEEMTKGVIWVGVKTEEEQQELCQKAMGDLGVIRLEPSHPIYDEHLVGMAFWFIFFSSAACMVTLAVLVSMATFREGDPSSLERTIAFISFIVLLLDGVVTAFVGLGTRGANKWLKFDVEGANVVKSE